MPRERLEYNGEFIGILNRPWDGLCATLQISDYNLDRIKLKKYIKKAFKKLDEVGYEGELHLIQTYSIVSRDDWILKNLVIAQKAMAELGHKVLMRGHDKTGDLKVTINVRMQRR